MAINRRALGTQERESASGRAIMEGFLEEVTLEGIKAKSAV